MTEKYISQGRYGDYSHKSFLAILNSKEGLLVMVVTDSMFLNKPRSPRFCAEAAGGGSPKTYTRLSEILVKYRTKEVSSVQFEGSVTAHGNKNKIYLNRGMGGDIIVGSYLENGQHCDVPVLFSPQHLMHAPFQELLRSMCEDSVCESAHCVPPVLTFCIPVISAPAKGAFSSVF